MVLTNTDIQKLKEVFATKTDLDRFATKEDLDRLATKEDLKRFTTTEDLNRFATKEDLEKNRTQIKQDTLEVVKKALAENNRELGKIFGDFDEIYMTKEEFREIKGEVQELKQILQNQE